MVRMSSIPIVQADCFFTAKVSYERLHYDVLRRCLWTNDALLHYEATVGQVGLLMPFYYCLPTTAFLLLPFYYCLPTTAFLLLPSYYCLSTTAFLLLPSYYCLSTTAFLLLHSYYCIICSPVPPRPTGGETSSPGRRRRKTRRLGREWKRSSSGRSAPKWSSNDLAQFVLTCFIVPKSIYLFIYLCSHLIYLPM